MFILTFTLFLVLLMPPLFLLHILWLLASTVLTGKRITEILHGVVVLKEDCCLPQPPGFFSLESRSDNLMEGCALTDSSSISLNNEHIDKHPASDILCFPSLDEVCVVDGSQTCSHEDIVKEPSIYICSDDAPESPLLTRRRSRKFSTPFQKLSLPSRVRRHSTFSKTSSSFLKRLSGGWNKPQPLKRQKDDANLLPRTTSHARKRSSPSWLRAIKLIIYPPDASAKLYIRELHVRSTSYP